MFLLLFYMSIAVQLLPVQFVSAQDLYNSTLACTRGSDQTNFAIDCRDIYADGGSRVLSIRRVFFGATPLARGCNRTAPYANCCVRDSTNDSCVFQVDAELEDILRICSGASYCSFSGKRISTSLGNCDLNVYPSMTSFSFVEYNCFGKDTTTLASVTTDVVTSPVDMRTAAYFFTTGPPESVNTSRPASIFNSSLACTRGAEQTYHDIDCRDHYPDGGKRALSIIRVFYGTTPLSSGCNRTAPYNKCCVRDPNKVDCVFQNDGELQEIVKKYSGASYCSFPGLRVSSSLGNCDPNIYPPLTSFSFVEYQCLSNQVTGEICSDVTDPQTGQVYLESNTVTVGKTVANTRCQCLITTECDSILTFFAITVQLTEVNATTCAEEIVFTDVQYPQLTANVTCRNDDNVVYNQSLFTSQSNMMTFNYVVTGQQKGKVYIRAQSSVNTAKVTLTCGSNLSFTNMYSQNCTYMSSTVTTTSIFDKGGIISAFSYGSSNNVGAVRNINTGAIVGIVFGVIAACVIVFLIVLLCTKYNQMCGSSGSETVFFVDRDNNKPTSRLWSLRKWPSST